MRSCHRPLALLAVLAAVLVLSPVSPSQVPDGWYIASGFRGPTAVGTL